MPSLGPLTLAGLMGMEQMKACLACGQLTQWSDGPRTLTPSVCVSYSVAQSDVFLVQAAERRQSRTET